MRSLLSVGAAMVLLSGPSAAVAAGGGQSEMNGATLSYTVQDAAFDGPGCANVVWSFTYTKPPDKIFEVNLELRQASSNQTYATGYTMLFEADPDTGTRTGQMCVDDSTDLSQGGFVLDGSWNYYFSSAPDVPLASVPVNVSRDPSHFVSFKVRAKKAYRLGYLRGKVRATAAARGLIGAGGSVRVERYRKGAWQVFGQPAYLDPFGRFEVATYDRIAAGTRFRARLSHCGWCTDASARARAK